MTRRRKSSNTWWGEAWLAALERIDRDTNRLPRGRNYARRGMVKGISLVGGRVEAQVQGRRVRPYRESIHLQSFSPKEKEKIKKVIRESPVIEAGLALGHLPRELLSLLQAEGIELLPRSWRDINAACSCPDWANPCKHLAAVYYILGGEIDKDPFILFRLRGMTKEDLTVVKGDPEESFISPSAWDLPPKPGERPPLPDLDITGQSPDVFLSLLTSHPLFALDVNFKKDLREMYLQIERNLRSIKLDTKIERLRGVEINLVEDKDGLLFFLQPPAAFSGIIRSIDLPIAGPAGFDLAKRRGIFAGKETVLDWFIHSPLLEGEDSLSPSVIFLSTAAALTQALMQKHAYLPRVTPSGEGGKSFFIEYTPLLPDEFRAYLEAIYPPGLICRREDGALCQPEAGVARIMQLFCTRIVHFLMPGASTRIGRIFFCGEEYTPGCFAEEQTAKSIEDWLAPLRLPVSDLTMILKFTLNPRSNEGFDLEVFIGDKHNSLLPPVSLQQVYQAAGTVLARPAVSVQKEAARQLLIAARHLPRLEETLKYKGSKPLVLDREEMFDFLRRGRNIMEVLGFKVSLPKGLEKPIKPQVAISAKGDMSLLNTDAICEFSWEVAVAGAVIPKEELQKLLASASGLVQYRGNFFFLTPLEAENLLKRLNRPRPRLQPLAVLYGTLTGELRGTPFIAGDGLKKEVAELRTYKQIKKPKKLKGELRPYQKRGYRWLYANISRSFGVCLADDMGLGKTIQAIALVLRLKQEGNIEAPVLIICPTSLLRNWQKEIDRFAPDLKVLLYHGLERKFKHKDVDVMITTYQIIQREVKRFNKKEWRLIILDEAQNIKNAASKRAQAVKSLQGKGRVALTGTPMENRLQELWSIMDFLNPGYLGSEESFRQHFALPIEKYRNAACLKKLKSAIGPFVLRREKSDRKVIADLPAKLVQNEYCHLTPIQAALYREVIEQTWVQIEKKEGIQKRGMVFKLLTALKQICNHPDHYSKGGTLKAGASGKTQKLLNLLKKTGEDGEKTLVFTQYKEMGFLLQRLLKEELAEDTLFFHGGLQAGKREEMVQSFQGHGPAIMIVSLRAGGTGLNLTAAANVIHYDLWWNPAVEHQATDRTHRIGQKKDVKVRRLITKGTLEEKIDELMQRKEELVGLTITAGEQWLSELSDQELKELVQLVDT